MKSATGIPGAPFFYGSPPLFGLADSEKPVHDAGGSE
jgi:hypothetical protein